MPRKPKGKLERDADHKYTVDGKPIPGVTSVIANCGLSDFSMVKQEILELAQLRGTYVHATCQFFDEGDLVEDSLSPTLRPYLEAWKKFRKDTGFKPTKIEAMDYSATHWVAGQVDRIGLIRGAPAIVDIKPATFQRWWALQVLGYALIFFPGKIPLLIDVALLADGTYRIWQVEPKDFLDNRHMFLSALKIWNWKNKK